MPEEGSPGAGEGAPAEAAARQPVARWLLLAVVVVVADQLTKLAVGEAIPPGARVEIAPGWLYLIHVHNPGAAFSFLSDAGGWQRWLLSGLAAVVSVGLVFWLTRLRRDETWLALALALLLGGAIGNLWDRVLLGHVVDFVQVYLPFLPWRLFNPWPAFNVADSAISVGVVLLLLDTFRPGRS
jgi:signal peptidase II